METSSLALSIQSAAVVGCDHPVRNGGTDDLTIHGAPALLREVLVDAIRVYCRAIALGGTWSPEYREAKRWLFDDSSQSLMSFATLCEIFTIDARELRRSLRLFPHEPDPRLMRLARLVDATEPLSEAT